MAAKDFVNYYALLGITKDADEAAIRKAYRKRALELHPDKNPDNPKADELFMAIKVASDTLLDKQKRSELDAKLFAQEASAARFKAMDSARARMREDLESRERQAAAVSKAAQQAATVNVAELERLRRQGREAAAAYSEQQEAAVQEAVGRASSARSAGVAASTATAADEADFDVDAAVLVRWTAEVSSRMGEEASRGEEGSGSSTTLSERQLRSLFKLYGGLRLLLSRKARSACLVFDSIEAAEAAVAVPPDGFRVSRLTSAAPETVPAPAPAAVVGGEREGERTTAAGEKRPAEAQHTLGSSQAQRSDVLPPSKRLSVPVETVPSLSTVLTLEADMLATLQGLGMAGQA